VQKVGGELELIGDKSLSHRCIMFSAIAEGRSKMTNLLNSGDTKATIGIFKELGVEIVEKDNNTFEVEGVGLRGLSKPNTELNALSSGTTARLLIGLLSKQNFESQLNGSDQLKRRPMKRIIDPLNECGAKIVSENNKLPVNILPSEYEFETITTTKPSAQVKSALLLAAIYHKNFPTTITEMIPTRDHSERMLDLMGVNSFRLGNSITIQPVNFLKPLNYKVPGDPSSAAFLLAIGVLVSDKLVLKNILLNERRIGFIKTLKKMNANISIENLKVIQNEPVGDIVVSKSELVGVDIDSSEVADMVDEFPIFTLLASQAKGTTRVTGAEELRVKESDRIAAMAEFIIELGGSIKVFEDGFEINGAQELQEGSVNTHDDHRIAMTAVVANICINRGIVANNIDCISDSYPSFFEDLSLIGANYEV
jgi:3-phosphoshikimate 1-carboxyvinyltransferase